MKGIPVMLAALLVSGALAVAQVCPPGYVQPSSSTTSQVYVVPPVGAIPGTVYAPQYNAATGPSYYPMVSSVPGYYYYPMTGAIPGSMYYPMTGAIPGSSYYPLTSSTSGTTCYPMTSSAAGTMYYPMTSSASGATCYPMTSAVPSTSYQSTTNVAAVPGSVVSPICPSNPVSSDTACTLNQLAMLRGDITSQALVSQGQSLVSRMNQLMSQEQVFRQAIAMNPNLPDAQLIALQLNAEAQSLNRDIASFNRQLAMVPQNQRPFVASTLNSFDVAYWQPTMQAFSTYQAQLPSAMSTYQPAFAQNPWLQTWFNNYQASLAPLSQTQQVFASASWWNQPIVLGSTEVYPTTTTTISAATQPTCVVPTATLPTCTMPTATQQPGTVSMLPNGAVVYIPANVASVAGLMPMPSAVSMLPYPAATTTTIVGTVPGATVVSPVPGMTTTPTVAGTTETTPPEIAPPAPAVVPPPATTTTGENY